MAGFIDGLTPVKLRLDWLGLMTLEAQTGQGVWALLKACQSDAIKATHVQLAFKLGLTGGGLDEEKAIEVTARVVQPGAGLAKAFAAVEAMLAEACLDLAATDDEVDLPPGKPGPLAASGN